MIYCLEFQFCGFHETAKSLRNRGFKLSFRSNQTKHLTVELKYKLTYLNMVFSIPREHKLTNE